MGTSGLPSASGRVFHFSKDGRLLADRARVGFEFSAPKDSALAVALATNSPFPPEDIELGQMGVRVTGGDGGLRLGEEAATVSFRAGGGIRSGIGVYSKASSLKAGLDRGGKYLRSLELPRTGVARFVALRWDYDIQAAAKGAMALGYGGSVEFGAEAAAGGLFAVIRAFAGEPKSRDALQSTLASWRLPRQVDDIEALAPGTWLVAEVNGQFAVRLGAQFGYDFNWIQKAEESGLSGDIGLRIQAAVNATVGFSASGKYLLTVARESTNPDYKVVRLRLNKLAKKGWTFALNAGVSATGNTGKFLPSELDGFLAAIFGVHGPQLVEDLKTFREWTDPTVPIDKKFAGFVSHYVTVRLQGFAGGEIARYEEARKRVAGFLNKWDDLPHAVTGFLWSEASEGDAELSPLEADLRTLAVANNGALKGFLSEALSQPDFFRTPTGKWIENAVTGSVLEALSSKERLGGIREAARKSLVLASDSMLGELVVFAGEKLRVDLVKELTGTAEFSKLEPWLQGKIEEFLGKRASKAGIEKLRRTLHLLEENGRKLYTAAVRALNSTYDHALNYTYASSTERTALIDVSFDFEKNPDLGSVLRRAVHGDFNDVLVEPQPGVTLQAAKLTHGIRRQSHLEIHLPYWSGSLDQFNNSLARMDVVEDGGRLFVYDLKATDAVRAGQKWQSSLAVTGKITVGAGTRVRTFDPDGRHAASMGWRYSFRSAVAGMRSSELEERIRPLIPYYFPRCFGGALAPAKASVTEWANDLDRFSEQLLGNGTGNLGDTLLSLEVVLPGETVAAWLEAPAKHHSRSRQQAYLDMSRAIQQALRRLIPYCYFSNPARYTAFPVAASLLVYRCLPVSTSIRVSRNRPTLNTDKDLYWDYRDRDQRFAMIHCSKTEANLRLEMDRVRRILEDVPKLRKRAGYYAEENLDRLRASAWSESGRNFLVASLLRSEAITVAEARKAGWAIAAFHEAAANRPEKALEALARFGRKITETFHKRLSVLFGGQTARQLGSLVFLEAARALNPALAKAEPSARLEVIILKKSAPESWARDYLAGESPDSTAIAVEQPVISLSA